MIGWATKPLGELCEVLDRYRKPITKSDRREGPYPYYGAMGVVDYVDGYLFDEPLILLGEDGAKWGSGEPCAFKAAGKYWVNNHAHIMRPDRSKVLDEWLVYYLCGADLLPFVTGLTVPKLNQERMREIPIPVPPLEEQRRIVAMLDEAFAAIATATANAEKNLANARELFSSEIRHLFKVAGANWEWKPIGEVADARLGKMLDKRKNKGALRRYLRNLNVRWFRFDLSDVMEMRFEEGEFERYTAKRGDLLVVEGGYPGRAAIWDGDEPIHYQKAVHRVRFDDPLLAKLLMYLLFAQSEDGTLAQYCSGAGIQHLTGQALARIPMPLPPANERKAMVAKVEAMLSISEEAQQLYQSKLGALNDLTQSLLHRAFTGELTATMPETIAA